MADRLKLAVAMMFLVAGVAGYYILVADPELWRALAVIAGIGLGVAVYSQTANGRAVWAFVKESRVELSKVVWPTRKETVQTTLVVIALVILVALFLWVVDLGLTKGVSLLTGGA